MASEVSGLQNGNYAPHQPYGDQNSYAYTNNAHASQSAQPQAPPSSSTPSNAQAPQQDIPKDEVGWYFVEQYYTTLSRSPDKLYLFYNKRSQFVSGLETDKVAVCVGQRAINDKIKDLDFHDCKVRVTNVDSQASDANIVIQVIGELSNRGQPHRKFSQTFVLATQTNGYFVLNDIFRYLIEEEDEPEPEPQQQQQQDEVQQVPGLESSIKEQLPTETPQNLTSSTDPVAVESDAKQVDKGIEEKLVNGQAEAEPAVAQEEAPVEEQKSEEEAPAAPTAPAEPELERTETAQVDTEAEKPKDPEPTRAPTPKEAPAQPAAAPKPAAPAIPKTWASLAASANRVATPAAPQNAAPAAKAAVPKPATSTSQATPVAPAAPAAPTQREEAKSSDSQDEWTAVGGSHNRQQSKQTNAQTQEQQQNRGYIKNVHENVDAAKLKAELEKFGELQYFDIARQKVSLPRIGEADLG